MISSVLVANRGEIACRIFRTCRELGIATVAVYSDPDASALHVREADAAVRLPGATPEETCGAKRLDEGWWSGDGRAYLRGESIVKAALAAGADAVHPGYGFLSENAEFARAVTAAGLVWIGPPPEAIEAMASKTRAKALMGISPLAEVTAADLPVLVKAAAGGGGRGMRVVRELSVLDEELAAARAEALGAFGDGEVFVEPYVEGGRHVEVQILADAHGTVWALGTRDCSLQRRHQKVIEEAPAPGLSEELDAEVRELAVRAARAVSYVGAGTVEFLVAGGRAHFLEMNTRLQVEHPVTEAVFGVDLVELQVRVAEGEALPLEPPAARGHAVEARLYAEDPSSSWAPQAGRLHLLAFPTGVRVDTGFASGDVVGVHYDPMLAKVVAWAPTRAGAVRRLAGALARTRVHGVVTNRSLLVRSLLHPEFASGAMDTGFFDRHLSSLVASDGVVAEVYAAAAAAVAASFPHPGIRGPLGSAQAPQGLSLWSRTGAWRNLASQPQAKAYVGRDRHEIRYHRTRTGFDLVDLPDVHVLKADAHHVTLEIQGIRREFTISSYGEDGEVHVETGTDTWTLTPQPRFPEPESTVAPGSLLAPMPGTVVRIAEGLTEGAEVEAGQPLLWLEAMKMEHRITAPATGTLTALHVTPGRQVEPGTLLAVVQPVQPVPPVQPAQSPVQPAQPAVQPVPNEEAPTS
ncbi:ATP-grasp domain-containing protein [Streptomyces sp. TRM66268-LWL]|uniref:ATP-grasp domain-containing protein n=1 Tax=Streptomyces polyasparticus TaxID=2767826 RepID=A0ABR7SPI2_9ACTN|nr:biotin carboxylase N-terminal domain-containing protein [Streptomyces polyasparticus]MBC9716441.1 ATP-grasp domain-containing protein [Streptomyces polyasparticus]